MASKSSVRHTGVPEEISNDPCLLKDLTALPSNYNFEIPKTIWKIRSTQSKKVALQFPEGLLIYSTLIADLLEKYTSATAIIMGDVTYGACCVDHFTAKALECDLLVHYGHSCLIPIQETPGIQLLYVFVDISFHSAHFLDTIKKNFSPNQPIAFVSTIQFVKALHDCQRALVKEGYQVRIPQCKPLSPGEILGCTSPKFSPDITAFVYLGDGRFHLESAMVANPLVAAFQYDPYSRQFTREQYAFHRMKDARNSAIQRARHAQKFGLILGTLGRQGNTKILQDLEQRLKSAGRQTTVVLLSEIFPSKLDLFPDIDCWVQVACPRLSVDWGEAFSRPILTPYELAAALDARLWDRETYPMDYYANDSLGPWTNNHPSNRPQRVKRNAKPRVEVRIEDK